MCLREYVTVVPCVAIPVKTSILASGKSCAGMEDGVHLGRPGRNCTATAQKPKLSLKK